MQVTQFINHVLFWKNKTKHILVLLFYLFYWMKQQFLIKVTCTRQHAILLFYSRWTFEIFCQIFNQLFPHCSESDRVRGIIQPWQFRPWHLPGSVCEWPALSVVSPQSRWPSVPSVDVRQIFLWMWRVSILHQKLLTRSANALTYWSSVVFRPF